MPPRGRLAEIVVEADHPRHLGPGQPQIGGDGRISILGDEPKGRLHILQDRQKRPFPATMGRKNGAQARGIGHVVLPPQACDEGTHKAMRFPTGDGGFAKDQPCQRASASSSASLAATQLAPSRLTSFFQNGARDFR